jgi:hypothetical protein
MELGKKAVISFLGFLYSTPSCFTSSLGEDCSTNSLECNKSMNLFGMWVWAIAECSEEDKVFCHPDILIQEHRNSVIHLSGEGKGNVLHVA